MVSKVFETEQGLAVLIPKEMLEQLGLTLDSKVSIKLNQELGQIIITPASLALPSVNETPVQYHDNAGVIEAAAIAKSLPGVDETFAQLVEQAVRELEVLPEALVQEVLDFIGYLRTKYEISEGESETISKQDSKVLETFGAWQDDRDATEIVKEIYEGRTSSRTEYSL